MAIYQIEWKKSALRELRRIDRQVDPRILDAVNFLSKQPLPKGSASCKAAGGPIEFVLATIE